MKHKTWTQRLSLAALAASGTVSAWAQGTPPGHIDYGPPGATAVPTLGEWALGLLGLLLVAMAYRALRRRAHGQLLAQLLLVGGLVAGLLTGGDVLRPAMAIVPTASFSAASGGTVDVGFGVTQVSNTSGVAQQIKALRATEGGQWTDPEPESPRCTVGRVVPVGGTCFVRLEGEFLVEELG